MKQQFKRVFFYSCSEHDLDEQYHTQLAGLLRPLLDEAHLEEWSHTHILAGEVVTEVTRKKLESAAYILLLLSPDYLNSESRNWEMQEALKYQKSGEACVIPIRLRPCELPRELEESLCCLPYKGKAVSLWDKCEAAFSDVAQDIRLILGLPSASSLNFSGDTDRERLLRIVSTWILGVLKPSFEGGTRLHLLLEEQPDALANPDAHGNRMRVEIQEYKSILRPLFAGMPMIRVYDDAAGELLILGEPGTGKTTLLLELTYKLLIRAKNDEKVRVPVVFPLSSWAKKKQALDTWLVEVLEIIYQVPRKVGQRLIKENQILPLLDGLDEVVEQERAACVQAIEAYRTQKQRTLVVCCRRDEYLTLPQRLALQRAVCIQQLTDNQIEHYLQHAEQSNGEQLQGLRQALHNDRELNELAHRPLMLYVFTLVYRGVAAAEVPTEPKRGRKSPTVFSRYVERVLKRRGLLRTGTSEQFCQRLTFIAKQLHREQQTVFSVEDLQPDWLQGTLHRFRLSHKSFVGLSVGLFSGLFSGLLFGLLAGLFVGPYFEPYFGPSAKLAVGLFLGLFFGLFGGFSFGLLYGLTRGQDGSRIRPAEVISLSGKDIHKVLLTGLLVAVFAGLFSVAEGAVFDGLFFWPRGALFDVSVGLFCGFLGMQFGLLNKLSAKQLTESERTSLSPNEGIRRSGKNGLLVLLVVGLLGGVLSGLVTGLPIGLFLGLPIGLVTGLFFGLFGGLSSGLFTGLGFGLDAFVQHFVLRFWLWSTSCLPWKLIPFLDEATERLLLRKVGGSYIFVHRLLQDYLASLDQPASTESTSLKGKK